MMNRIEKSLIAAALVATVSACSSGSDGNGGGSAVGGAGDVDSSGFNDVVVDDSEIDSSSYPSNADLSAANGIPTVEQAYSLVVGSWSSVNDATQCATTYTLNSFEEFSTTAVDQRGSGTYAIVDFDGAPEIEFDYDFDNFLADCRGFTNDSDALEPGVSFLFFIGFPDQDTMVFSNVRSLSTELFRFTRQ